MEATFGRKRRLDMFRDRIATLTPREREVFELVIRGDTNKLAARALGCTERTVKAHGHRVMEKTRVPIGCGTCVPCRADRRF